MKLRTKSSEQASTSRAVQMLSDKSSKKGVLATSGNQWDLSKTVRYHHCTCMDFSSFL